MCDSKYCMSNRPVRQQAKALPIPQYLHLTVRSMFSLVKKYYQMISFIFLNFTPYRKGTLMLKKMNLMMCNQNMHKAELIEIIGQEMYRSVNHSGDTNKASTRSPVEYDVYLSEEDDELSDHPLMRNMITV